MNRRLLILWAVSILLVIVAILLPRIPQDPSYHLFADNRTLFGIPNCLNVISNLPLLWLGLSGLFFIARVMVTSTYRTFVEPSEALPYTLIFLGTFGVAFGSAYFHGMPNNQTLLWDRLPMSLAFTAFLAAVITERVSTRWGLRLLPLLILLGLGSVLYWHWTELQGVGDLRPYALIQFGPILLIPLLLTLFPARYSRTKDMVLVLGWYALAKVFEILDKPIYELTGDFISGHTLKHLAAALAAYWILRMLQKRDPLAN